MGTSVGLQEGKRNNVVAGLEKVDDMGQIRLFQKQEELKEKCVRRTRLRTPAPRLQASSTSVRRSMVNERLLPLHVPCLPRRYKTVALLAHVLAFRDQPAQAIPALDERVLTSISLLERQACSPSRRCCGRVEVVVAGSCRGSLWRTSPPVHTCALRNLARDRPKRWATRCRRSHKSRGWAC